MQPLHDPLTTEILAYKKVHGMKHNSVCLDAYAALRSAAVNYPIRLLSRQCNPFTTEILAYINKAPEKIIVLSDLDEHMAFSAGNSFYEKGVDNVFIVSGGKQPSPLLL